MPDNDDKSKPFYVWNGLLTERHRKTMGESVWIFLWCLDRTTAEKTITEDESVGVVAGERTLTISEIAPELGYHPVTTSKYLSRLEQAGYLVLDRNGRGAKIYVTKTKRWTNRTKSKFVSVLEYPQDGEGRHSQVAKADIADTLSRTKPNGYGRHSASAKADIAHRLKQTKPDGYGRHSQVAMSDIADTLCLPPVTNCATEGCEALKPVLQGTYSSSEEYVHGDASGVPPICDETENTKAETYGALLAHYRLRVHDKARVTKEAKKKIDARLKKFSEDDLKKAMDNISSDNFFRKNNAERGMAWFFHTEERVARYRDMTPSGPPFDTSGPAVRGIGGVPKTNPNFDRCPGCGCMTQEKSTRVCSTCGWLDKASFPKEAAPS